MACNGDSTTLAKNFTELGGTASNAQLPSGAPYQIGTVNLTAQAVSIAATTLFTVPITGFYRLCLSVKRTVLATTSSTLPSVVITWTDGDNSAAGSNAVIASNVLNTLVAPVCSEIIVYAKAGTVIQYSTTGYVSSPAAQMQYALRIKCEAL